MSDEPLKHEWVRNSDGSISDFEMGEYCDGPRCLRCKTSYCRNCDEKAINGPCPDQTTPLFDAYPDRPRVIPGPESAQRKSEINFRRRMPGGPNYGGNV